jgi:ABC-type transport system substrate-binding protein
MTGRARLRLGALLLLLAAAGPGLAYGQSAGELRVALPWTPENLDPTMNLSSIRAKVGVSLFDSLVGRDADNRIVPQLAESWKALDDLTWQFKLRRGVVFHNGEPFNAEAVRFTFERVLDPNQKSPNRANVSEVARVDVLDDYTVNLVLRQPYAPLVNRLIDFSIVPPKYTAEKGNQGLALRPVGTGPFRFVELIKDDHLIVEAFDRHWRGASKVRRIIYKAIPEPFTRAAALRNNEVDVIDTLPPNLAAELERVGGIHVQRVPSTWIIYLGLNALKKPLSDVRVRQARGQWQKAGFKPRVQVAEWGAYFKRYLGKQFQDAYLLGLGGPMQDGDEVYNLVSSKGRGLYYKNERVDQLFDAGRSTMDPAKRRKIYADLARAMVEDATWVFLMQQVDIYATRERVTWKPRGDQWMPLHEATLR